MTLTDQRVERAPEGELRAALRESYAVFDHLTTGHRNRGCNRACDWWPRVEAIRGRNR